RQACKVDMSPGMATQGHPRLHQLPELIAAHLPLIPRAWTEMPRREEECRRDAEPSQDGKGVYVVVFPSVIKGDRDVPVRSSTGAPNDLDHSGQGDEPVAATEEPPEVTFETFGRMAEVPPFVGRTPSRPYVSGSHVVIQEDHSRLGRGCGSLSDRPPESVISARRSCFHHLARSVSVGGMGAGDQRAFHDTEDRARCTLSLKDGLREESSPAPPEYAARRNSATRTPSPL